MAEVKTVAELQAMVGQEIGVSDWVEVPQEMINAFAECTGDKQWIHVDVEKAEIGPYGTTIAHGFLTLSMIPVFGASMTVMPAGITMAINYGLDKVRFISPVKVGSKVRAKMELMGITPKGDRLIMKVKYTAEIEGEAKPAFVAEMLVLFFIAPKE